MTFADKDDAERLTRSVENAVLYDTNIGEWEEPHIRALNEFIELVLKEQHDKEWFLTRRSTPNQLNGAKNAFETVFENYQADVCVDFADLLSDTYYMACLTDIEQAVVSTIAEDYQNIDVGEETAHAEVSQPVATAPNDEWKATIKTHTNGYITVEGIAERAQTKLSYETGSKAFTLRFTDYKRNSVRVYNTPTNDCIRIGTLVAFNITSEDSYSSQSRVERVVDVIEKKVDSNSNSSFQQRQKLANAFKKLANGDHIKKPGYIGNDRVKYNLNMTELIKTARIIKHNIEGIEIPDIIKHYAKKELE